MPSPPRRAHSNAEKSRRTQYRELKLFLQAAPRNAEIADCSGKYKGNDTFENYFVSGTGESDTMLVDRILFARRPSAELHCRNKMDFS